MVLINPPERKLCKMHLCALYLIFFQQISSRPTMCSSLPQLSGKQFFCQLLRDPLKQPPLPLIDMQRPCVITEKRCDPHHVIANLTIFNTISRAIFMHFLCQIPFDDIVYLVQSTQYVLLNHCNNSEVQKWPLK